MSRWPSIKLWRGSDARPATANRRKPQAAKAAPAGPGVKPWLWRGAALLLTLAVVLGAQFLWRWLQAPTTLPIRTVVVRGELTHVSTARVRALVNRHLNGGFFGVNLAGIAAALDALPWVARADVRRVWPSGLAIRIEQHKPVARWNADGLLNATGQVFRPLPATFPKGLPALSGPRGQEHELMNRYVEVNRLFARIGLRVVALSENARRAFHLRLSNGIEVVIGRDWGMPRMARLVAVYPRVLAPKAADILRIDLRYTNGFAVAWKSSAAQAATASRRH